MPRFYVCSISPHCTAMHNKSWVLGALALVAILSLASAVQQSSFGVHRLLQSSIEGTNFGSQKAAVSMPGAILDSSSTYSGNMLVLKIDSVSLDSLKQVRKLQFKHLKWYFVRCGIRQGQSIIS